jgi:uncharacterized membrane protein
MRSVGYLQRDWRREALRTNLWVVPAVATVVVFALFGATHAFDRAAYNGRWALPTWVISGTADAGRQILTTIAAAIITVVGVVFSITIVALTLASTQFGPRMLRTFIRDRGTQVTLGTFVATFVYAVLVLVSIGPGPHGDFVPHLSITVTLVLTLVDLALLIYFINHIASSIQLPQVIAGIARDLARQIDVEGNPDHAETSGPNGGPSDRELLTWMGESGAVIPTPQNGYLQVIRHETLVKIATEADAVIHLPYRPGHFLVRGNALAVVWPPEAADYVAASLKRGHVTGPYRTLAQDVSFGVDQLVEIAIRALSPAVNDTFTALTCIDWLCDCLCRLTTGWHPQRVRRDPAGRIRLITYQPDYERLVARAFEKIRQAGRGMPAVMIRQLDALHKIMDQTAIPERRQVLLDQAVMIQRSNLESVAEPADRADVERRYQALLALHERLAHQTAEPPD